MKLILFSKNCKLLKKILPKKLNEIYTSSYERGYNTVLLKNSTGFIGQMGVSSKDSGLGISIGVYFMPAFRSNYFATILLEKTKSLAKEKGITKIKLETLPFMKQAIQFYLKNGFQYCNYFPEIGHSLEVS